MDGEEGLGPRNEGREGPAPAPSRASLPDARPQTNISQSPGRSPTHLRPAHLRVQPRFGR